MTRIYFYTVFSLIISSINYPFVKGARVINNIMFSFWLILLIPVVFISYQSPGGAIFNRAAEYTDDLELKNIGILTTVRVVSSMMKFV